MEAHRNNSKKRSAILEALAATRSHPTAEMLYNTLKESDPNLGLATVYRNLGILIDEGAIITVGKVNGQERYDADTHTHGHFICRDCGSVYDFEFPADALESTSSALVDPGFVVEGCELRLTGICSACRAE